MFYPGLNGSGGAMLRGASRPSGSVCGPFAGTLNQAASYKLTDVGFRCTWKPRPTPSLCSGLAGGTWTQVPGDSIYGTSDFCVQKYVPSNVGSAPISQSGTSPWVNINQTDAATACSSLGSGYHLITNPEWMTVAANAANVGANWSNGVVGSGALTRGHSDNSPASACAADANDADGWVQTNCTGQTRGALAFIERRTRLLSNGEVIWDIGGNTAQWVNYNNSSDKPTPATNAWYEYTAITGSTTTPKSHLVPQQSVQNWWSDSWNSTQSIGQIYPGTNGSNGALNRGGKIFETTSAGMFAAVLVDSPSLTNVYTSFRCAYTPPSTTAALDTVPNKVFTAGTAISTFDAGSQGGDDYDLDGDSLTYSCYFDTTVDGTVASTTACSTANLSNGTAFALNSSTGAISGWQPANNGTYEFKIIGCDSGAQCSSTIFKVETLICGSLAGGTWVAVPGNSVYGTNAFCVQKYVPANVSNVPTSQTGSLPWVSITQPAAATACTGLGAGYHLITNPEWMTIATNLANVGSNWSGGAVGSGTLSSGHSDDNPASACAADANDANAWVETNCTGQTQGALAFSQRRTQTLSNNNVLWDIGGHVFQWVNFYNLSDRPTPTDGVWHELTDMSGSTSLPKLHLVPQNNVQSWWNDSWNSTQFVGQMHPGSGGSGGALMRGAGWYSNASFPYSGPFSAYMNYGTAQVYIGVGFRCAYSP